MKVFQLNDVDCVAAKNIEEAIQFYYVQVSNGVVDEKFIEEFLEEPFEISEAEMNSKKLIDIDEDDFFKRLKELEERYTVKEAHEILMIDMPTYAEVLKKQIAEKEQFPLLFSSSEW